MYLKQLNKLFYASMISICTASFVHAETKATDITHDVVGFEESAYGEHKGYVATKSSTGSKMDVDILEIPQSVSVVTKDMMETRNVQTIQNATAYNAAITQPYGENGDVRTNYGKIRGVSHLYRSTFLDGLKLLHAGHNIPNYDAYALERVEILKGPSSVLYGASGPGGLLNLQSKKPNLSQSKEIGFSYATNSTKSVFADINHNLSKNIAIRLTSKIKQGDNQLKDSTHKSYLINPSLSYFIDDETTLDINTSFAQTRTKGLGLTFSGAKANLDYHNSIAASSASIITALKANPATSALFPNAAAEAAYAQNLQNSANAVNALNLPSDLLIGLKDQEIFEKKHKAIGATLNKTFSDKLKLRSTFRYMRQNGAMDYSQPSASGLLPLLASPSPDLTKLPMEFIQVSSDLDSFAFDNNLELKSSFSNISNTSLFGLDIQHSKYNEKEKNAVSYTFDLANPHAALSVTPTNTVKENFSNKILQTGIYASNSMKIYEKFVVNTSLRYDKLKDTKEDKKNSTTSTQKDDNVSGRLGFTYLMDNGLAPYATYSTSFTTNIGSNPDGSQFKPSTGRQYEVGLKYKPQNFNGIITLAAYDIIQKDTINKNSNNRDIQMGDVEVQGLEFDVVSEPVENLNVTFSAAKAKGKQTNMPQDKYNGMAVDGLADFTASIWSDYTFKDTDAGDVQIGAGIKYIGKSKNISTDYFDFAGGTPLKEYDVKAYTVVDAMVGTKYKDLDLALNVNNLFDKKAQLDNMPLRVAETAGRTLTFTAKYKF